MSEPRTAIGSSTARVLAVLEAFSSRSSWGVRELAAALGVAKSGVHRTLQELAEEGIVATTESGDYFPAAGMLRLASLLSQALDLPRLAAPHLTRARDQCGETVILTMYDRSRRQFIAVSAAESTRPVRYIWEALRDWSDLHLGASGKGILAFLPAEEQQALMENLPDPIPGVPRRSKSELKRDLREIRARGFATSVAERFPGARGVSAPVYDAASRVVGAVVIGWPDRPDEDERAEPLGRLARQTAHAISGELGAPLARTTSG